MSQTWSPGGDIRCLWITWGLQRPLKAILTLKLNNWSQNDLWWFLGEWLRIRHNFIIGGRQWCQCPNGGARGRAGTRAWEAHGDGVPSRGCTRRPPGVFSGRCSDLQEEEKIGCFISILCFMAGCLLYFPSPFLRWIILCLFICWRPRLT